MRHSSAADSDTEQAEEWRPKALEIGAGTGALGLSVAACGVVSSIVLSDMAAVLPLTQANLAKNRGVLDAVPALCIPLLWCADSGDVNEQLRTQTLPEHMTPVQLVIGSDLLYRPDDDGHSETRDGSNGSQQAALLGTLSALLQPDSGTVALIALVDHVQGLVDAFIQKAAAHGLVVATLEDYCATGDCHRHNSADAEGLLPVLADAKETDPPTVLLRLESSCSQPSSRELEQQQHKRRRRTSKVVVVELDQ
jgi:hypothetical protein